MPSAENRIETINTNTANEFFSLLSPEKPLFPLPSDLLYRGQANAEWNLVPSILRSAICTRYENRREQASKEWKYLERFVNYCDLSGLPIPNDSPRFRDLFLNETAPPVHWPPKEMFGLMALAQHYRVPTRLLDWSTRSYVAAYFAISDALALSLGGGDVDRLAVWILDIERQSLLGYLKIVKVAGSNNINLAAQAGRFTLLPRLDGYGESDPLGEIALDRFFENSRREAPLKKITLPVTEAKAAMRLCSLYGVSGATLFPDYNGAAKATLDDMRMALQLS
jgi:FRG domain